MTNSHKVRTCDRCGADRHHEGRLRGARGLCPTCYGRAWANKDLPEVSVDSCLWPGCEAPTKINKGGASQGFCKPHFGANISRTMRGISFSEYDALNDQDRRHTPDGYIRVRIDGGWRPEHTLVMESILGRPMVNGESVHHINGIRDDNRPENLELWVGAVRYGQRAADLCCPSCGSSYLAAHAEVNP